MNVAYIVLHVSIGISIIAYTYRKKTFAKYLKEKNDPRSEMVKQMNINRLLLPWRDNTNKNDCGVSTMWHEETYMEDGPNFNSGFGSKKNDVRLTK